MPIYSFQCDDQDCGHVDDLLLKMSERDTEQECTRCGNTSHRIMDTPNFHLDMSFPGRELKYSNPDYRFKK